jgi:type I restriction enzyme M protein
MPNNAQEISLCLFAADQLWTNTALRPDQYAQPVLTLIALRQIAAKFIAVDAGATQDLHGTPRSTTRRAEPRPRPFSRW